MRHAALGLFLLLGAGLPALAQEGDPAPEQPAPARPAPEGLELSATASADEVTVGERFTVKVTLTNAGEEPVELHELAFDRSLVSFDVQLDDGRVFTFAKIHPSPYEPRTDWPRSELQPGAAWELEVGLPAVAAGAFKVTPHYGRPPQAPPKVPGQDWTKPEPLPEAPPHLTADPLTVTVKPTAEGEDVLGFVVRTNVGPIRGKLLPAQALGTCLHFANLVQEGATAEGKLRPHFYDGLTFHRVVPGFMIQGGCPKGDGTGDAGYAIPAEFPEGEPIPEEARHKPGRVAMARSAHPHSAGTQFYVCVGTPTHLDAQYTVFAEVTRGMDVAYTIADVETEQGGSRPRQKIVMREVRVYPVKR